MRAGTGIPGAAISPDPDAVAVGRDRRRARRPRHAARPALSARHAERWRTGRRILLERDGELARGRRDARAGRTAAAWCSSGSTASCDRTAAEALRGTRLLVRRADFPALDDDEFYHHDVLGFAVETLDGAVIGTIAERHGERHPRRLGGARRARAST